MADDIGNPSAQTIGRRGVLAGFAGAAALAAAPAMAQGAGKEAPALATMVADGKLPKLAERLPEKPLVVTPLEKVGTYGGQLRRGLRGSADHNGILRMVGNQGLVRWNAAFTEVLPNVAESWEVNDTSTVFTFKLRKGMKWSDGHPFTADDIVFAVEDCCKNSVGAVVAGDCEQAWYGGQDRRYHGALHLRGAICAVPRDHGYAAGSAANAVPQALREPVPSQIQ